MAGRQIEYGANLPLLGAAAHKPRIAARTKSKREGVKQDRLARSGLAGQHGEAATEIEIDGINQNNVANRKAH